MYFRSLAGAVLLPLLLALGGCATFEQKLGSAASVITSALTTPVTPTEAIVTANTYNGLAAGATGFLTYCKSNASSASCTAGNRRAVIKYVRAGRAARNQVEQYIQANCPSGADKCGVSVPAAIFDVLTTAVANLRASPAANYAGAK